MNELKRQVKEAVWQIIESHYNVTRSEPRILTLKSIVMNENPIDQIGETVYNIIEQIATQMTPESKSDDSDESAAAPCVGSCGKHNNSKCSCDEADEKDYDTYFSLEPDDDDLDDLDDEEIIF